MLDLLTADPGAPARGFSWLNLLVLVAVVAVAWPFYSRGRAALSRRRRERWAREEEEPIFFTEENDPDLRRNARPPQDSPAPDEGPRP